jgi:DNA-directed RNA polymerase specialized sigma24 family protein
MRPKNLGLSDEQVHQLESLASRPKTAQRSVYRAKIILSRLAGAGVRATAKAMNCKPATVRKWCRRVAATWCAVTMPRSTRSGGSGVLVE